jgi:uncharacterized protein YlxW (UPF0749 family)
MSSWRAQLLLIAVCLLLGLMLVPQLRSERTPDLTNESLSDQATYISSLVLRNRELQDQVRELQHEVDTYKNSNNEGSSTLINLAKELQRLRIANGEVDITGPGVRVTIHEAVDARHLQDAVNELRNAGAEGMAVNQIRLLTRSVIGEDGQGHILVDKQQIASPYVVAAIGDPATLEAAANRKGGLFELWRATEKLTIQVDKITEDERAAWITMPKTALEQQWRFAKPQEQ